MRQKKSLCFKFVAVKQINEKRGVTCNKFRALASLNKEKYGFFIYILDILMNGWHIILGKDLKESQNLIMNLATVACMEAALNWISFSSI